MAMNIFFFLLMPLPSTLMTSAYAISLWLPVFSSVSVKLFSPDCVMRPFISEPLRNLTFTRVSFLFSRFTTSVLAFVSVFRLDWARAAGPVRDKTIANARKGCQGFVSLVGLPLLGGTRARG